MNNIEKYFFDQADQANETFAEDPREDVRDDLREDLRDDYEEELLAESESEERPTRTRAERRKNAFKAKARRVEILKNKGFSPEYEYCEKWLRQGKKMSEIRSKKSKDNEKSYRQARRARRNPNLSGKGNAYRRTTRGWYD